MVGKGVVAAVTLAAVGLGRPAGCGPRMGVVFGRAATGEPSGYVVMLDDPPGAQSAGQAKAAVADAAQELSRQYGGEVREQFSRTVRGFAVDGLTDAQAAR